MNQKDLSDTIVAVSTPPGRSAIGVIRMSGPESLPITERIFRFPGGKHPQHCRGLYGRVLHPETSEVLDDGIVVFMKAPHSYTGEDVVEISLHGSPVILQTVLEILTKQGARPAQRGEFTRRAFLAGKMNLMQAEAVVDLIDAASPAAAQDARTRLDFQTVPLVQGLSDNLKDILALIEAHLDFDEDDEYDAPTPLDAIVDVLSKMETLRRNSEKALMISRGIQVCIAGKPNVGKSTLFNALLRNDRTIVSPTPGTTRDTVEDRILLGRHALALWDTAGIREPGSEVEDEGIRRTLDAVQRADLVLVVLDGAAGIDHLDESVLNNCSSKKIILVVNKMDLVADEAALESITTTLKAPCVCISAKTGRGVAALEELLGDEVDAIMSLGQGGESISLNARCLELLITAAAPLERIRALYDQSSKTSFDIIAFEIRSALSALEEITGERVDEGVLDRIFDRFCVGK